MFSINVDASRFTPPQYSISSHITTHIAPNVPIVPIIPIMPIIHNISFHNSAFMPLPTIPSNQFHNMNLSINALRVAPDIPPNINNFGKSIADAQQLHSITRAECIRNVNSAHQFNNQLQCGVPNAMTGLMAQEPEMAQCVINLQQQKMDMLNGCSMLNN